MLIRVINLTFRTLSNSCKEQVRVLSNLAEIKPQERQCIITCKQPKLNHYSDSIYKSLDEVPLASKGWNHSKSKGDHFTVHPLPEQIKEETVPFHQLKLNKNLITALNSRKIEEATAFQARVFPYFSIDKHLLLAAETGCGKTISYLLPIIENLIERKTTQLNTPSALILVPNRELAYQVGDIAETLAQSVNLVSKTIVGGKTKRMMMDPEFGEIDILVGTPGVVGKLSTVGVYKLHNVLFTVLDEADTLSDDSFSDRVSSILRRVPQSKLVLVSATMLRDLPDFLKPIEGNLKELISPKLHKPLLNNTQKFLRMTRAAKPQHLLQIAKNNKHPLLIFTNRNKTCNWVSLFLNENGVPCSNINGDMNYAIRIEQWNNFIRGDTNILSATDVGSRGLDTTQVLHVLNYDFPIYAADYLHRVGRVGRLGGAPNCKITNLISGPEEVKLVQQIELAIRRNQPLPNVDGNITNIVQKKIQKGLRQTN